MLLAQLPAAAVVRRSVVLALGCASLAAVTSCAEAVADSSKCRNLAYKNGGVAREQYLPCAAEMIAALDDLDRQSKAALDGDQQARSEGQASLRRVMALMSAAGGRQLLERWDDRTLTDLNVDINNAVSKYQAFYMVRILDDSSQFAKESRAAAAAEFAGATRRYDEAKRLFRRIS